MEFEVDGKTFRTGKLNARDQFHVSRRLGPVIGPVLKMAMSGRNPLTDGINPQDLMDFVDAFALMDDEQVDYILDHCLAVVAIKQGEGWPAIMSSDGKNLMFEDLEFYEQSVIVGNVIWFNFEKLFQKAQATLNGAGAR